MRGIGGSLAWPPTDLDGVLGGRDLDQGRERRVDRDVIVAGDRVDDQRVLGGVRVGDPDEGGQAADIDRSPVRIAAIESSPFVP